MQRNMVVVLPAFVPEDEFVAGGGRAEGVHEALPDIVDGQGRGMDEIVGIEAVVTQFIEHYFVRFEIDRLRL